MKKNQKIFIILFIEAILIISGVAVTLAYLSDKTQATNTFTIGDVDIEMLPQLNQSNGSIVGGKLELGEASNQDPRIRNIGANDAFIKVEITISNTDLLQYISIEQLSSEWTSLDTTDFYITGYATLYYNKILQTGENGDMPETPNIFDSVTLDSGYLEGMADGMELSIKATAIQTRYNGSVATSAQQAFGEFETVHPK